MIGNGRPGKRRNTRTDKAIFSSHPKKYKGCAFFVELEYVDTGTRKKGERVKATTCIIFLNRKSTINILDFTSKFCLEEYQDRLLEWDRVTPITLWCDFNNIPWRRFIRTISKTQIMSSIGDFAITNDVSLRRRSANKVTANKPRPAADKIYKWG